MKHLTLDVNEFIATITLNRPPVNAVNNEVLAEIREMFDSINNRKDVRVAIFTAAGERAFMGGADLNEMDGDHQEPPLQNQTDAGKFARDAMWAITDCAVPVIGAINGPAIGAGVAFAACCDILIAADNASFGTLEINVGLLGASSHLLQMVGRYKAREMFFLGEKVPAQELFRLGAIRQVVSAIELMPTAVALAQQLAQKSPIALRLAKESMNRVEHLPLKEAYRTEQEYTARLMSYEDSQEARRAYLEKRAPDWKWR